MGERVMLKCALVIGLVVGLLNFSSCGIQEAPPASRMTVPKEFASKHMPEGWWNDEGIIGEGRQLYLGIKKRDVNCAKCHGKNGKPVKSGARDFRNTKNMKKYSDSQLLWRIAEGVPYSQMRGYKGKLTEKEMWKVIAFLHTFALNGLQYNSATQQWESYSGNGSAEEEAGLTSVPSKESAMKE